MENSDKENRESEIELEGQKRETKIVDSVHSCSPFLHIRY